MVKVLSNFDTKAPIKNYANAVQEYGFDRVVFVRRYGIYLLLHVFVPIFIALLSGFWAIHFFLQPWDEGISKLLNWVTGVFLSVVTLVFLFFALARYLNYLLDYTIITPEFVAEYNQSGILHRTITTIEIDKIKTINFTSGGFLWSLFNYWRVDILLEWDESGRGDLTIDFVFNPEEIKYKILDMMGRSEYKKTTEKVL